MCPSLSKPAADAETLAYDAELSGMRQFVTTKARQAGVPNKRVKYLVIAVNELAANTLAHTAGAGTLLVLATADEIVCQIHDGGDLTDVR
jgi:anti-sigma regulatory factor (Ser/Thr protein kinase)